MRGHVKRDAKALQRIRQLASSYSTLFLKLVAPPRRVAVDASACQSLPVNACACQSPPKIRSEYSTFLLKLILAPQRSIVPMLLLAMGQARLNFANAPACHEASKTQGEVRPRRSTQTCGPCIALSSQGEACRARRANLLCQCFCLP
jgi:hypothetical protein